MMLLNLDMLLQLGFRDKVMPRLWCSQWQHNLSTLCTFLFCWIDWTLQFLIVRWIYERTLNVEPRNFRFKKKILPEFTFHFVLHDLDRSFVWSMSMEFNFINKNKMLVFKDTSLFTFLWNPQFLNLHKRSSWSSVLSARCKSKVSKQVNSFKKIKYVFLTDVFLTLIRFKWEYVHKTVKHIAFLFNFFILLVIFHMVFTFEWVNVKTKLWNYCVILVEIFEISKESMILDIGWINVFHQLQIKKICESISS
jgi:hypothetical protein